MFLLVLFNYRSAAMLEKHGGMPMELSSEAETQRHHQKEPLQQLQECSSTGVVITHKPPYEATLLRWGHYNSPSNEDTKNMKRSTVDSVDTSQGISIAGLLVGQLWTRAGWIPASLYHNSKYLKCTLKCPTLPSWSLCHKFCHVMIFP